VIKEFDKSFFFAQFPRNGADIGEILLIGAFLSPLCASLCGNYLQNLTILS
jgi:hypothetical protein